MASKMLRTSLKSIEKLPFGVCVKRRARFSDATMLALVDVRGIGPQGTCLRLARGHGVCLAFARRLCSRAIFSTWKARSLTRVEKPSELSGSAGEGRN